MKKIYSLALTSLLSIGLSGQLIETNFKPVPGKEIAITADYPDLVISTGTNEFLSVKAWITQNGKPINEGMEVFWDENDQLLRINTDFQLLESIAEGRYNFVENPNLDDQDYSWKKYAKSGGSGYWNFDLHAEIVLPENTTSLRASSTYGDIQVVSAPAILTVVNTYGHVEVALEREFERCDLSSTYSDVSLNIASGMRPEVKLQSRYGDIYTNMDLDIDRHQSINKRFEQVIVANLNAKRGIVKMRSDYSNIYLRKF